MNTPIRCCSLLWLQILLPRHWYVTMSTGCQHLQELVRFHRHKWRKPHYIISQLAIGLHSPRKRCHCRSNKYYILGRESHLLFIQNKIISNKRISLHICSIWSQVTIKLQNKQYGYSDFFLNGPVLKGLMTINTIDLCSTNIQVLTFVSNIIFKSCTPADSVCQTIKDCILVSKEQIVLLKVSNLTSEEL